MTARIFARRGSERVAAWGEERLIRALRGWLGWATPPAPGGMGDDCAVLGAGAVQRLITVDPLIYGRHFDGSVPARAAGAKLLKRNLSDIAAMGGRPTAAVVGLILSGDVSHAWLAEFYRGLAAAARRAGVAIVGGDVAQAPSASFFSAHLTLLGSLPAGRAVARAGGRIGDSIYVTGTLGRSLPSGHHFRFEPRLPEGRWLAARDEVRAMMDVSDGLAKDLRALTPRGSAPAVYEEMLPRRGRATLAQALSDGEDYELVFAVGGDPRRRGRFEAAFHRAFPRTKLTRIGKFVAKGRVPPDALALEQYHGYQHLIKVEATSTSPSRPARALRARNTASRAVRKGDVDVASTHE